MKEANINPNTIEGGGKGIHQVIDGLEKINQSIQLQMVYYTTKNLPVDDEIAKKLNKSFHGRKVVSSIQGKLTICYQELMNELIHR